jgi:hypothetical protein
MMGEFEKMSQQSDFKEMMEGMMGGVNKEGMDGMNEMMKGMMGGMDKDGAMGQLLGGAEQ